MQYETSGWIVHYLLKYSYICQGVLKTRFGNEFIYRNTASKIEIFIAFSVGILMFIHKWIIVLIYSFNNICSTIGQSNLNIIKQFVKNGNEIKKNNMKKRKLNI